VVKKYGDKQNNNNSNMFSFRCGLCTPYTMRKLILRNILEARCLLTSLLLCLHHFIWPCWRSSVGFLSRSRQMQVVFCIQNMYCFSSLLLTHVSFYCTTHGVGGMIYGECFIFSVLILFGGLSLRLYWVKCFPSVLPPLPTAVLAECPLYSSSSLQALG